MKKMNSIEDIQKKHFTLTQIKNNVIGIVICILLLFLESLPLFIRQLYGHYPIIYWGFLFFVVIICLGILSYDKIHYKCNNVQLHQKSIKYWCIGVIVLVIAVDYLLQYVTNINNQPNQNVLISFIDKKPLFLGIITIIIAPIIEENIFRGILLECISGNWKPTSSCSISLVSMVASTIFFIAAHCPNNIWGVIMYAVPGIGLMFIRWKSKHIFPSIITHMIINTLAIIAILI